MAWIWAFLDDLSKAILTTDPSFRNKNRDKIDTQIVLPVLLKELDHIQAIIGRYDTFFFLMKQLCLGAILAVLGVYLTKTFHGLTFLVAVPILFFLFDYGFRVSFWSDFTFRVEEVGRFLDGRTTTIELYGINSKHRFWPRAIKAFKPYDLFFYLSLVLATWGVTYLLDHPSGFSACRPNPWVQAISAPALRYR